MELFFVDFHPEKLIKRKSSNLHNLIILVGLLLTFNLAAYLTQLSQGIFNFILKNTDYRWAQRYIEENAVMSLGFFINTNTFIVCENVQIV